MDVNAVILESDKNAAQTLLEMVSPLNCVIASDLNELKSLLHSHSAIQYLFCIYDVSSTKERLREQSVVVYVRKHYSQIDIYSIGSIKKEEVTLSDRKVLLIDQGDINDFAATSEIKRTRLKKFNLKLKSEAFKKRGVHVVQ